MNNHPLDNALDFLEVLGSRFPLERDAVLDQLGLHLGHYGDMKDCLDELRSDAYAWEMASESNENEKEGGHGGQV